MDNSQPNISINGQNPAAASTAGQFQPATPIAKPKNHKALFIILGIIVGFILLFCLIFFIVSATSKKMECTSTLGNITIMYNDDKVTGYTATDISYDLDTQQAYSQQVGISAYLDEFADWFTDNTGGTCKK